MTARARILALDNYDSFTFTLVDYLRVAGADVSVVRNDDVEVAEALDGPFNGFLISPGPGHPRDAGASVELARACMARRRPLLGVCLGHQAIAEACGHEVDRVQPVHGKVTQISHDGSGLFAGLPSPMDATRYHSLALASLSPPLLANAWSEDGVVMGLRHRHAPVHGVQFHPESVASDHGHRLVAAFVRACS